MSSGTGRYDYFLKILLDHLHQLKDQLALKGPKELYQPQSYMLSLGGKRLRPVLLMTGCDLFEGSPENAVHAALSVELFHNFTLMHDDILDNAPLRRGKETVHGKWNSNIAILSGDAMLVKAFQLLQKYPSEENKKLLSLFCKTALEVCEGQQMDMNFETDENVTAASYLEMITKKTAVLLGCSLQMGAITAGADADSQAQIYEFGKHIGIAFQLMDDYLDVYSDVTDNFGKQPGGDIISNKKTFLLLKAFELANPTQEAELRKFMLFRDGRSEEKVRGVKKIFDSLNVGALCKEKANEHTSIAISCLEAVRAGELKKSELKAFALNLLNRQS